MLGIGSLAYTTTIFKQSRNPNNSIVWNWLTTLLLVGMLPPFVIVLVELER